MTPPPRIDAALARMPRTKAQARPLADTLVFARRALLKIRHTPEQAFDVVVTPIMFTVIFTYLFGGALAGSTDAYLTFLLPGILVQTVMFAAIYTGFTLNQDIHKGVFDRFRAMPIWRPAPIAGALVGDIGRHTASALLVFAAGLIMGYRAGTGPGGILATLVLLNLYALGIGWVFTALALLVRTPGTMITLSWLFLMPVTFGSNIYVDPATMPGWLQLFVTANSVSHVTTALRGLLAGAPDPGAIGLALLTPAMVVAVFAPLTMWLYGRER